MAGEAGENIPGAGGDRGSSPDIEGMARRAGWVPQDEWTGKPEKWAPADKFVERLMDGFNGRSQERYRRLDDAYARQGQQLEQVSKTLNDTVETLGKFSKYYETVEARAYEKAKAELIKQRDEAVLAADPKAHARAVEELEQLEESKPKPIEKKPDPAPAAKPAPNAQQNGGGDGDGQVAQPDPVIVKWNSENDWYKPNGTDRMSMFAVGVFTELNSDPKTKDLPLREKLDMVTEEVKEMFPKKFENPRRNGGARVNDPDHNSGGGGGGGGTKGRRYEDLPKEAKAECDRFAAQMVEDPKNPGKQKPLVSREQYLADYPWE